MLLLPPDTVLTCSRKPFSYVTFYDSSNIVNSIDQTYINAFPFRYIENNKVSEVIIRQALVSHLKEGRELPIRPFHDDWIVIIVLFTGFLYSFIRTFSKTLIHGVSKFFIFRNAGEITDREISQMYHWQSTLINLITFINLSLFIYFSTRYYDLIPSGISNFLFWLISLTTVIFTVSLRHIICFSVGKLSGQKEAFGEYMLTVYIMYRFLAFVLFLIVILLAYSKFFHPGILFLAGFILIGIFYLIRIIRLALIFIKRNISLLYLILYLCALEFLPVLIALKYITGLF